MEEQNFGENIENNFNSLLAKLSAWLRIISIAGFSMGAFFAVSMLFSGRLVMEAVEKAIPIKVAGLYGALIFVFFIIFFIMAAFLFFLYNAWQNIKNGIIKNDSFFIAEGFRFLRNFFIMMTILGGLSLLVNVSKLFY
jgi:hypothetical protein